MPKRTPALPNNFRAIIGAVFSFVCVAIIVMTVDHFLERPSQLSKAHLRASHSHPQILERLGVGSSSEVRWAHAVNNKRDLANVLSPQSIQAPVLTSNQQLPLDHIHMLEADVQQSVTDPSLIILAHPPARTSDLTLATLLDNIRAFNQDKQGTGMGRT